MASSANLVLTCLGLEIKVRVVSMRHELPVSRATLHKPCKKPVGSREACPHCHTGSIEEREQAQPACADMQDMPLFAALGTSSPQPLKRMYCVNPDCGKLVEGTAEKVDYCNNCKVNLNADDVAGGYKVDGKFFLLTEEEEQQVEALKVGNQMRVIRTYMPDEAIHLMHFGDTYQVLPGKGAEIPFTVFQRAVAQSNFRVLVAMKFSADKEHMALIMLDEEGTRLILKLLAPRRTLALSDAPEVEVGQDLVSQMGQVLYSTWTPAKIDWFETPARAAFFEMIGGKDNAGDAIPAPPVREQEQAAAIASQLNASFKELAKQRKREKATTK